jgi:hypothetical protein
MYQTIVMNTASNQSIALYPCGPTSYMKETYEDRNASGPLKNYKCINLPANRDGITFDTVESLFAYLLKQGQYRILLS